jgi:NAD(P)-dependent dehydrogenase (short-subunit alcohol dehydrogenase family)
MIVTGSSGSIGAAIARAAGAAGYAVVVNFKSNAAAAARIAIAELARSVPLKRTGTAEEVADVLLWLVSERASYVHGAVIDVTGGR